MSLDDGVTRDAGGLSVLHLSSERGWRGGERQVVLLGRALAERGADQAVAVPQGSGLERGAREAGLATLALPGFRGPQSLLRLRGWLRRRPGALLHAHTSPALDSARLLRLLCPALRVVYTRRTMFPVRPGRKYRVGADLLVAVSGAVAEGLIRAGSDPARVAVIPSAVDLEALDAAPALARAELPAGRPLVVCVAALAPEKRHDLLLAAWARVLERHPRACLALVGDGPLRERVAESAARLPPGAARLAGFRLDVPGWLKAADLAVLASSSEGIAGAVLEAMACSKAVVATAVGGVPEAVVDGETGLLVPPGDAAALARGLCCLLDDPGRRERMGRAGRRRVEGRFTAAAAAEAHLALYHGLAADRRPT